MAEVKSSLGTWTRLCWGFIFLVLVLVVIVVRWCWWCPRVPDCPDCTEASIIVEDMHAGVWMAFENESFHFYENTPPVQPQAICTDDVATAQNEAWGTCDPAHFDSSYRHGVIFQMGYLRDVTADTWDTEFAGVYIKHKNGETTLVPGVDNFDWLDVKEATSACVIDPATAYTMFFDSTPPSAATVCDPIPTTDPLYHCSRVRSLHASVTAHFLMTYWAGVRHFLMDSAATDDRAGSHEGVHVSYRFALPSQVTVDRWSQGCYVRNYEEVTEIRILYEDHNATHLGYPHKPMNGK